MRSMLFLSHASSDSARIMRSVELLEGLGIGCWLAPRDIDPGADWSGSILEALRGCSALFLAATPASLSSSQVRREVEHAAELGRPLLAAFLEPAEPPPWLLYYLSGAVVLDLAGARPDQVAGAVARALERDAPPEPSGRFEKRPGIPTAPPAATGLLPGRKRPVLLLRVHVPDSLPASDGHLLLRGADNVCISRGALPVRTGGNGGLYIIDSLSVAAASCAVGCAVRLGELVASSKLADLARAGVGLAAATPLSTGVSGLLGELEEDIARARGLAESACGGVLAGPRAVRVCNHRGRFERKGGDAWRLLGPEEPSPPPHARADASTPHPFRRAELEKVLDCALRPADGEGLGHGRHTLVAIGGESGSGRSGLADAAGAALEERGEWLALSAAAERTGWTLEAVWAGLMLSLGRRLAGDETGSLPDRDTVLHDVPGDSIVRELVHRSHQIPDRFPLVGSPALWRESLAAVLGELSRHTRLALLPGSIDRIDASSMETLRSILASSKIREPMLLLAVCGRGAAGERRAAPGLGGLDAEVVHIELEPLSMAESAEYALRYLEGSAGPAADGSDTEGIAPLLELAEGRPGHIGSLLDHALESGCLRRDAGGWVMQRPLDSLPPGMAEYARERLRRLPAELVEPLPIASLLQQPFDGKALRRATAGALPEGEMAGRLEGLVRRGVLRRHESAFRRGYAFASPLLRRVAADSVPDGDAASVIDRGRNRGGSNS